MIKVLTLLVLVGGDWMIPLENPDKAGIEYYGDDMTISEAAKKMVERLREAS